MRHYFSTFVSKVNKETGDFSETKRLDRISYARLGDTTKVVETAFKKFVEDHKGEVENVVEVKHYTSKLFRVDMKGSDDYYMFYAI